VVSLGIFGVVGLVVIAGLAPALERRVQPTPQDRSPGRLGRAMRAQLLDALAGAAIVALVLAAGAAAIVTTEERCWIRADTPSGPVFRQIPPTSTITQAGEIAGAAMAASTRPRYRARVRLVGAIGTALLVTRTRPTARELPTPR
jgi:hypothetical protein